MLLISPRPNISDTYRLVSVCVGDPVRVRLIGSDIFIASPVISRSQINASFQTSVIKKKIGAFPGYMTSDCETEYYD